MALMHIILHIRYNFRNIRQEHKVVVDTQGPTTVSPEYIDTGGNGGGREGGREGGEGGGGGTGVTSVLT